MKPHFPFAASIVLLLGCQPNGLEKRSPDTEVKQVLHLKEMTTGVIAAEAKSSDIFGDEFYFGKTRLVKMKTLPDRTITALEMRLDADEPDQLQRALTEKISQSEGRAIRFDCNYETLSKPILPKIRVQHSVCTLKSGAQMMTIDGESPDLSELKGQERQAVSMLLSKGSIQLVDTVLDAKRATDQQKIDNAEMDKHLRSDEKPRESPRPRKDL